MVRSFLLRLESQDAAQPGYPLANLARFGTPMAELRQGEICAKTTIVHFRHFVGFLRKMAKTATVPIPPKPAIIPIEWGVDSSPFPPSKPSQFDTLPRHPSPLTITPRQARYPSGQATRSIHGAANLKKRVAVETDN